MKKFIEFSETDTPKVTILTPVGNQEPGDEVILENVGDTVER